MLHRIPFLHLLPALAMAGWLVPQQAFPDAIYCIGNSLTGDTRPHLLDGTVEYHLDNGRNLRSIYENPSSPSNAGSRIWTDALANTQYDWVTVQPYWGTTLQEDAAIISEWMQMQPSAVFVIHTGWPRHAQHEADYHSGNPDDTMVASPEYIADLIAEVKRLNPGRTVTSTRALDVLDSIYHGIEDGRAPFGAYADLFRDYIHMEMDSGRYLMHNLMRIALGQPMRDLAVDPAVKDYLDVKISSIGLIDLGQTVWDTVTGLEWSRDTNPARTESYGMTFHYPPISPDDTLNPLGHMVFGAAFEYIDRLNAANYLGHNDWSMPILTPIDGGTTLVKTLSYDGSTDQGYNQGYPGTAGDEPGAYPYSTANELAYMFHVNLGNLAQYDVLGVQRTGDYGFVNKGPFENIPSNMHFWFGVEYTRTVVQIMGFGFRPTSGGTEAIYGDTHPRQVWPVRYRGTALPVVE